MGYNGNTLRRSKLITLAQIKSAQQTHSVGFKRAQRISSGPISTGITNPLILSFQILQFAINVIMSTFLNRYLRYIFSHNSPCIG